MIAMEAEERRYRTDSKGRSAVPPVKMVVGNKCDLDVSRGVSAQEGLRWAKEKRATFMETSAMDFVNVEETFAGITKSHSPHDIAPKLIHLSNHSSCARSSPPRLKTSANLANNTPPHTLDSQSTKHSFLLNLPSNLTHLRANLSPPLLQILPNNKTNAHPTHLHSQQSTSTYPLKPKLPRHRPARVLPSHKLSLLLQSNPRPNTAQRK
jgi:hypothetical protein